MLRAESFIGAERCSLFLYENKTQQLYSKVTFIYLFIYLFIPPSNQT